MVQCETHTEDGENTGANSSSHVLSTCRCSQPSLCQRQDEFCVKRANTHHLSEEMSTLRRALAGNRRKSYYQESSYSVSLGLRSAWRTLSFFSRDVSVSCMHRVCVNYINTTDKALIALALTRERNELDILQAEQKAVATCHFTSHLSSSCECYQRAQNPGPLYFPLNRR